MAAAAERQHALKVLQSAVEKGPSAFADYLHRHYTETDEDLYSYVASLIPGKINQKLWGFALTLATHPHQLPSKLGDELDKRLKDLQGKLAILRGARFLAILRADNDDDHARDLYGIK